MGLNVAWRWAMPQVGSPNTQSDAMAAGLQGLAQGIGNMISNSNKEKWLEQNQSNLDRDYALRQEQVLQNQKNWQAQFDQAKALQDFNMQRQKNMMDFIKSRYGHMLGIGDDDPVKQEYDRLLAELKEQQLSNQAQMIMMGLNPQFMR